MKHITGYIFVLIFCISSFSGCIAKNPVLGDERPLRATNLLEAWIGEWTEDKRVQAISEYRQHYDAIAMKGTDGTYVTFKVDFDAVTAKAVCVAKVDDDKADFELDAYTDMYIKTECQDNKITVHTEWWYMGGDGTNRYPDWSYLVMVKDAEDIPHYYYFRVTYSK